MVGWWAIVARVQQIFNPSAESAIVENFQTSRQQTIAALRYFLLLLIVPLLVNQATQVLLIKPIVERTITQSSEIVLNAFQEERMLKEYQIFEKRLRFESLLQRSAEAIDEKQRTEKILELVEASRKANVQIVCSTIADLLSVIAFILFVWKTQPQLKLLRQFLGTLGNGLSDSAKAFLIIFVTDIFVGFHSSYGWEVLLKDTFAHYGLVENRSFIGLFIATFPVTLDVMGKYWVFRYLNRNSPSAVATYHRMNQ